MKILIVCYLHCFGGAEKQVISLANALAELKHDVTLCSLGENNVCYPISDNVTYVCDDEYGLSRWRCIYKRYVFIRKVISDFSPEVIIHFNLQSSYLCAFMNKSICKKSVYAERGDPKDSEYSGIKKLLQALTLRKIGGIVFQTKAAMLCFHNRSILDKSVVIPNSVSCMFEKDEHLLIRDKRIVSVGRLHEQKNQKLLVKAVSMLSAAYSNYKVEIYGDGELYSELQELINNLSLSNQVFLMGTFKDVLNRISNASVFVLSSLYEGIPNVLLEAMSLGLPCISTDYNPGSVSEILTDKENGLIIPSNDVSALTQAIEYILSDPERADLMGQEAIDTVRAFSPESIYNMWQQYLCKFVR